MARPIKSRVQVVKVKGRHERVHNFFSLGRASNDKERADLLFFELLRLRVDDILHLIRESFLSRGDRGVHHARRDYFGLA